MVRTQLYLTKDERTALAALSAKSGKKQSELIREAIDDMVTRSSRARREAILAGAAGMWKDRDDLPDFAEVRNRWERSSRP